MTILEAAQRLAQSKHPELGVLEWDGHWLNAAVSSTHGEVSLQIEVVDEDDLPRLLATAADKVKRLDELRLVGATYAANGMTGMVNAGYREEGQAPVTSDEVKTRIAPLLGNIHIDSEELSFQLTFGDDDLLWGHYLVVEFDEECVPRDVRMVG